MLKTLQIRNFALIDNIEIEFQAGLNIITGETGAGKSIIIDAITMLLGDRASVDYIRQGERKAIIEGYFEINAQSAIGAILKENDIDFDGNFMIIRREILDRGASRCFINDSPVQVQLLKQVGDLTIDLHGQHQHQSLLDMKNHIKILDNYAHNENLTEYFKREYTSLLNSINHIQSLLNKRKHLKNQNESYKFELDRIQEINPQTGEEDKIEAELKIIENSEMLLGLCSELENNLTESDQSVRQHLVNSLRTLEQLARIDSRFEIYQNECRSLLISIDEMNNFAVSYKSDIDFDSEKTEELRKRIVELRSLRKKYGSWDVLFDRKAILEKELALALNFDKEIENTTKQIGEQKRILADLALDITNNRNDAALKLKQNIEFTLKSLGMENVVFDAHISQDIDDNQQDNNLKLNIMLNRQIMKINPIGCDTVEFYFSANKGISPAPLSEIASGGEVSRVMLAIKTATAEADSIPVMIFDEIDSGISGRIAQKVGAAMLNLSNNHQIISITHLPQIAAYAKAHFSVEKLDGDGRVEVSARKLSSDEHIAEIAKLISGEEVSLAALNSAKELVKDAFTS